MKKIGYLTTAMLIVAITFMLSGCSSKKILNNMTEKGYFNNSYDNAIPQTDIGGKMIAAHFASTGTKKKKALLVTVDGFRVESLNYLMNNDLGIKRISKDGGLYWTKPMNLDTKAKVDIGVNFLSIITGEEPSTFNVLKNTDAKRETPKSVLSKLPSGHSVKFLTDNQNYIDVQLSAEIVAQNIDYNVSKDLNSLRTECINSLDNNDFILLATSSPYKVGKNNYKLSNKDYLAEIIHLNYYLGNIYNYITARADEDWLVIVASTCGGSTNLLANNEEGNILTFMVTNKQI